MNDHPTRARTVNDAARDHPTRARTVNDAARALVIALSVAACTASHHEPAEKQDVTERWWWKDHGSPSPEPRWLSCEEATDVLRRTGHAFVALGRFDTG
jgi:hypothetical protein